MYIRKNRVTPLHSAAEAKKEAEGNLSWAVGAQYFQHRDPLYHVTEDFHQTFDRIGHRHASELTGGFSSEEAAKESRNQEQTAEQSALRAPAAKSGGKTMRADKVSSALTRFSETAFQRGTMAASVLNGTGKMMLVSCIKRAVGESGPKRLQQQSLLKTGSQLRNVPGYAPDQVLFHRNVTKGALGIVVDTLRDARRVVDSMTALAQGKGEIRDGNATALGAMYPFLDDRRDRELEAQYREALGSCTDQREKPVLQNALVQVLALRAKKAQMKNEFINKLRFISDRAIETLTELEAPGIEDDIITSVWETAAAEMPENPDEGAEEDAPDGSENRPDPTKSGDQNTGPTETEP